MNNESQSSIVRYYEKLKLEGMFTKDDCTHEGPAHRLSSTKEVICADCKTTLKSEDYDWLIKHRRQSRI